MRVSKMIKTYYPTYYSIEHYPQTHTIRVHKITEEWGIFSNFAHTPLLYEGKTYDTAERLFQVRKMASEDAREMVFSYHGNPKMIAKHIIKVHPEWIRTDWPMHIVDEMKMCLKLKFEQSIEFHTKLKESQGYFIVEDQTTFPRREADSWGTKLIGNEYVGPNLLGRLLMELRDQNE